MKALPNNLYHPDLILANELAYKSAGISFESFAIEKESQEYGASTLTILNKKSKFRVAKVTPTKAGHFVAIWKRENGITKPHDMHDLFDLFIISVRDKEGFGQFIFDKATLQENGIISSEIRIGKRGMRVYPPWIKALNKQAKKTQEWQCKYFIQFEGDSCKFNRKITDMFELD